MTNPRRSGDFATLVGDWRRAQALSLEKASNVLGVAHTTVRDWERGRRPRPVHVLRLQQQLADGVTSPAFPPLLEARVQAGLSQRQLARRIYVSPSSVALWERSQRRPTAADIRRLGDVLGQPPNAVLQWFAAAPPRRRDSITLPALRALRIRTGLAQRTAAEAVGCAPATWAGWETGTGVPLVQLEPIAAALGISPRMLIAAPNAPLTGIARALTLRDLRRAADRTQADSARVIGVSTAALSRLECGRQPVTMTLAVRLADCYERPVAEVVRASGLHRGVLLNHEKWLDYELPDLLRTLRTEVGFTCRRAAALIGVGVGTLRHWERGTREPAAGQRVAVAFAYHGAVVHESDRTPCGACAIIHAWPQSQQSRQFD